MQLKIARNYNVERLRWHAETGNIRVQRFPYIIAVIIVRNHGVEREVHVFSRPLRNAEHAWAG
jgi:hypothetical protein